MGLNNLRTPSGPCFKFTLDEPSASAHVDHDDDSSDCERSRYRSTLLSIIGLYKSVIGWVPVFLSDCSKQMLRYWTLRAYVWVARVFATSTVILYCSILFYTILYSYYDDDR